MDKRIMILFSSAVVLMAVFMLSYKVKNDLKYTLLVSSYLLLFLAVRIEVRRNRVGNK
ncbi:MAG: hypothetical protein KDD41_06725 [Flavobacteriales bacterium]|nr:hypothetical protein [Flavobacteriales bacterium]